ncbi:hypothetical protein G6F43_006270 [Rhizopus delemar]|nr:hypothetical protein G6F43_006270 [Rhizopus delemar]
MIPSVQIPILNHPSVHKKDVGNRIQKSKRENSLQRNNNHHARTTSAPSVLPSYNNKLSLDVLLDAIDLDQQMRQLFRDEVMKSKNRVPSMLRRRSKSAPSAPPSYHQQRAFNSRWITNDQTVVTTASKAQEVAQLIVNQHFEKILKKTD